MGRTVWWLRAVGVFYSLLAIGNLAGLATGGAMYAATLPGGAGADALAVQAFSDAWLVFVLELGALGGVALYASVHPKQARIFILAIIVAEIFRGIVADAIWIWRGYSPISYGMFIAVHIVIIATGWWVLQGGQLQRPAGASRV